MKTVVRCAAGLLVGLSLSLTLVGSASAQEIPPGAARVIAKVEQQIFIATLRLNTNLAPIRENAATALANTRE